jgi:4-hydroxy-tetrahydrodipicolinate reductase
MQPIVIYGITGRMGQSLLTALQESQRFVLCGAIASADSQRLGQDAAGEHGRTGVTVGSDAAEALRTAAVALDFSVGAAVGSHARDCAAAGVPLLVGTTGFDADARAAIQAASGRIAVLVAPNTSAGVSLVATLAAMAARSLPDWDVDILEAHHRMKRDAPSGTALALGEAVAAARGVSLADMATFDRHGNPGPRAAGSLGFAVIRAGDIVGDHTVVLAAQGERIEITHRAGDRLSFARGALRAAEWLIGKSAGLYTMNDVLGL